MCYTLNIVVANWGFVFQFTGSKCYLLRFTNWSVIWQICVIKNGFSCIFKGYFPKQYFFVIHFFIYVDTTGYIIYNNIVNLQLYYFQRLLQIVNLVDFPCKENIWLMENYPLWCCSSYFSNSALHSSVAGQSVKVHQRAISSIFKQSGEQQHGFGCLIWPSHCVRSQDWKINTLMCTRVNTPEQERETSRQFCLWCCFTC